MTDIILNHQIIIFFRVLKTFSNFVSEENLSKKVKQKSKRVFELQGENDGLR
jgi:hypothetical protein